MSSTRVYLVISGIVVWPDPRGGYEAARVRRSLQISGPQQGDLTLSGPLTGQGTGGGAQTRDRMVPVDLRVDSLMTVPPTQRPAGMAGLN
ncbi:hypothetical protein PoB_005750000 [Plakobranchus ocellatus]|uniref:Uncharacterized protein n=1 Tax=Plakobranchus ocellatus TaxID=259542 RepID=A0AAV4CGU8_9GAST|nr:hypothetical protein PoB_005750000 [Plakobranchus ocellatus]